MVEGGVHASPAPGAKHFCEMQINCEINMHAPGNCFLISS